MLRPRARSSPPVWLLLLSVLSLLPAIVLAGAPTFCKCTCFKNSTLIKLGPDSSSSSSPRGLLWPSVPDSLDERSASTSCTQCTRAFCLSHNLPICKDAEESDTIATCFQRDSRKDELIVWAFILGTTGLLAWAAVKRIAEYRDAKKTVPSGGAIPARPSDAPGSASGSRHRGSYAPLRDLNQRNPSLR